MKIKIAIAAIAVTLWGTPAFAADILVEPVYMPSWHGPYFGIHGGGSWGDAETSFAGFTASDDYDGALGGFQGGYNWQGNGWVFGIEADFSFTGNDHRESITAPIVASSTSELEWLATIRARLGRDLGHWMPYLTAGVAFADNEGRISAGGASISDSNTHTGFAGGVGADVLLTDSLSIRGEYLFVDLGDEAYFDNLFPGGIEASAELHVLRAALNWHW